jgi:hypothetical protein
MVVNMVSTPWNLLPITAGIIGAAFVDFGEQYFVPHLNHEIRYASVGGSVAIFYWLADKVVQSRQGSKDTSRG